MHGCSNVFCKLAGVTVMMMVVVVMKVMMVS